MWTWQEGKVGANGKRNIDVCTPSCVKWIAGEKLLYNTGSPAWHSAMTLRGGMGGGEGGDVYIVMADSRCTAETHTTL